MLDWNTIHTVLLDMDGTLLDLNFDNHFWQEVLPRQYADKHGVEFAAAKTDLNNRYRSAEGSLSWYCLDYWTKELDIDLIALKKEIDHLIAIRPYAIEFLEATRKLGKRILLVTNAHQDSLTLKMEKSRLYEYFDALVCSHDYGMPKEDQGFWQRLYMEEEISPESALLIDDSLPVLRSAHHAGVGHILFVTQPDSQKPERQCDEFPGVRCFRDLIQGMDI